MAGKKLLIIGMGFHQYDAAIVEKFTSKGWEVEYQTQGPHYCEKHYDRTPMFINNALLDSHQKGVLAAIKNKTFDLVLVIVGRYLKPSVVAELRSHLEENGRMILYLWDDVSRVANFHDVKSYYDEIFSFDPINCYKYGFKFLPLFYTERIAQANPEKKYDLYAAFLNHSTRREAVESIVTRYPDCVTKFIIVMGALAYPLQRKTFLKTSSIEYRWSKPIPAELNRKYMIDSRALFDVQYETQAGLTIRSIESIGADDKLVTTNKTVRFYDFYDDQNIQICGRHDPEININLLRAAYKPLAKDVLEHYSVGRWVDQIVSGQPDNYLKPCYTLQDVYEAVVNK